MQQLERFYNQEKNKVHVGRKWHFMGKLFYKWKFNFFHNYFQRNTYDENDGPNVGGTLTSTTPLTQLVFPFPFFFFSQEKKKENNFNFKIKIKKNKRPPWIYFITKMK